MGEVTVRELRQAGPLIDRVLGGERVTITRYGRPIAQLVPLSRKPLSAAAVVARFKHLPPMDLATLRADIDAVFDQSV